MSKPKPTFHILHRCGNVGTEFIPKGEHNRMNTNEELLPPGVVDEEKITVNEANQILANWEDYPGLEPAFVTNLRVSQPSRVTGHGDDEGLYPPGVE